MWPWDAYIKILYTGGLAVSVALAPPIVSYQLASYAPAARILKEVVALSAIRMILRLACAWGCSRGGCAFNAVPCTTSYLHVTCGDMFVSCNS